MKGIVSIEFLITYGVALLILLGGAATVLATDTFSMTNQKITSCSFDKWLECEDSYIKTDIIVMNISSKEDFPIQLTHISLHRDNKTTPCIGNITIRPDDRKELICGAKPFLNTTMKGIPRSVEVQYNAYNMLADEAYTRNLLGKIRLIG